VHATAIPEKAGITDYVLNGADAPSEFDVDTHTSFNP
jgi:hypothetical protein